MLLRISTQLRMNATTSNQSSTTYSIPHGMRIVMNKQSWMYNDGVVCWDSQYESPVHCPAAALKSIKTCSSYCPCTISRVQLQNTQEHSTLPATYVRTTPWFAWNHIWIPSTLLPLHGLDPTPVHQHLADIPDQLCNTTSSYSELSINLSGRKCLSRLLVQQVLLN